MQRNSRKRILTRKEDGTTNSEESQGKDQNWGPATKKYSIEQ